VRAARGDDEGDVTSQGGRLMGSVVVRLGLGLQVVGVGQHL
jgi:hypothetical protein